MDVFDLVAKITLNTNEYESGLSNAESKGSSFASKLGGGLKTAAKVGTAAVGAITGATALMGGAMIKGAGNVASYGDNIDKMSQKMGISATAYQEWDAIMQHSGTSIEALKPSMKTLATQAQKNAEEFQKLGISQEEVANLSQEDLFAKVITGLQGMEEGTERTAITSKLLGRGATELGALLNTSAEDTEKMRQAVHDLGGVMSDEAVKASAAYQDQLQDMKTAMDGLKRNMMSEFLPSITTVMQGLTTLFAGGDGSKAISDGLNQMVGKIAETLPRFLEVGSQIITSLANAIIDNLPMLIEAGTNTLLMLLQGLVEALPRLLEAGIQVLTTLIDGITQALPELIPAMVQAVTQMVEALIQNMPLLIEAAVQLITGLAQGLIQALPVLLEQAPVLIGELVAQLIANMPLLVECAIQLIIALAAGLIEAIPQLIAAIPQIILAIVDTFKNYDWKSMAKHVIDGLKNGISEGAKHVVESVKNLASNMLNKFKSIFGIHSPSTVMQSAGKDIGTGLQNGMKDIPAKASQLFSNMKTGVTNLLSKLRGDSGNQSAQMTRQMVTQMQSMATQSISKMQAMASQIGNHMRNMATNLQNSARQMMTNVVNQMQAMATQGQQKMQSMATNIRNVASQIPNQLGNAIQGAVSTVSQWGQNLANTARSGVQNMVKSAVGAASGLAGQFRSIGANLVAGLRSGIGGAISGLYNSIYSNMKGLVTRAKSALGIHSPSKEFAEIGKFSVAGLGEGWDKNIKDVRNQIVEDMDFSDVNAEVGEITPNGISNQNSQLLAVLAQYLPQILDKVGNDIYLDRTKVGAIMDNELGRRRGMARRANA